MKRSLALFCALVLPLAAAAAEDPFAPLAAEARPLETRWQTDYIGTVELGVDYVGDDNFMFGRYNGRDEDEAKVYGNIDWRWITSSGRWDLQADQLGTDVGFARVQWDRKNLSVYFELEGTRQVSNDSGRTPFRGDDNLSLPGDWISSNVTSGFSNLDSALHGVDLELERDRYTFGLSSQLGSAWKLESSLQYEEKDGTQAMGAAIFQDASAGHSAILPQPVDYESLEFDLSLNFNSKRLLLNGSLFYNEFDNNNDLLSWENPYDIFGPAVRYPNGTGGLGLAPDNEYIGGRLLGTWFIAPGWRFQLDGSYAETTQDQNFASYTANDNLTVTVPVPRNDLNGTTETSTMDTRLFYRPLPRLNLEFWWHGEQRETDQSRDGYQYVLGDGGGQVGSDWTVYNTGHDYDINRTGIEANYPLPWRSKIWLKYEYYKVERENAAVEETEEDRYSLKYRIPIMANLHSRLELLYADRAASTYHWDQSYYALLDTGLINRTPDSQRYNNHPLLAQYQLANRERSEAKLDLSWQPAADWSLGLNVLWRDDEFDKSQLGLEEEEVTRVGGTVSWLPNPRLSISGYASYDDYQRDQNNRAFRGGIEKMHSLNTRPCPRPLIPAATGGYPTRTKSSRSALTWSGSCARISA